MIDMLAPFGCRLAVISCQALGRFDDIDWPVYGGINYGLLLLIRPCAALYRKGTLDDAANPQPTPASTFEVATRS